MEGQIGRDLINAQQFPGDSGGRKWYRVNDFANQVFARQWIIKIIKETS